MDLKVEIHILHTKTLTSSITSLLNVDGHNAS